MKYFLFFLIITFCYSCNNSKSTIYLQNQTATEVIYFEKNDSNNLELSKNTKYNLTKKSLTDNNFELYADNYLIFKFCEKDKYFIYEIFKSRFLLISSIPIENKESSPFNLKREIIYLCDLSNKKLYFFYTKNYILSPFRNSSPIKYMDDFKQNIRATINDINTENNEVTVLLSDLMTTKILKLLTLIKPDGVDLQSVPTH